MIIDDKSKIDENKFLDAFEGSIEDLKSAYMCVRYLLLSAVRYGATKEVFSIELQQLGFSREHSIALGKVLDDKFLVIKEHLRNKSLSVNKLKNIKCLQSDGIDCIIKMAFEIEGFCEKKEVNIDKLDIPILLKELKTIKIKMDEING